jgi:Uri superfamily endonuclease
MQKSRLDLIGEHDLKKDVESQALHFMNDLKKLKRHSEENGRRHWFIFIMGTTKSEECQVHLWRLATDMSHKMPNRCYAGNTEYGSTVLKESEESLQGIYTAINESLGARNVIIKEKKQPIITCLDNNNILKSVGPSNIMCRMGGGIDCNTLTLRICYEILVYHSSHLLIAKDIADAIKNRIEPEREIPAEAMKCFMEEGDGFADSFCSSEIFEKDPKKLKKMIAIKNKEARLKFDKYDLDGNLQ